jgi:hypothetical protein
LTVLAGATLLCLAMGVVHPAASAPTRLHVDGRFLRTSDGARFAWRGLTSFRLLEMVAHGREAEAQALLDWASARRITIVRVLAMADVLFKLTPTDGRLALPRLLDLAAARGLYVEVVALADTARLAVPLDEQVAAVGRICDGRENCVIEVANEPWHGTQRREVQQAATLRSLRSRIPARVPVSYGPPEDQDSDVYAGGDYLTFHVQRTGRQAGWGHVRRMRDIERLGARTGKPVVDDEPIGAAERTIPGRRDSDPVCWLAKGLLARVLNLGATFHYEGGLQSRVPQGAELACFDAWRRGLESLPPDLEERAVARDAGTPGCAVTSFDRRAALEVYVAQTPNKAFAVAVGVTGRPALRWQSGWSVTKTEDDGGVVLVTASR